jgi:uncharacterized protein (DUF488 family)
MPDKIVFTVGHSTHDIKHFIELLNKYGVNCLIDVRSSPYSRIAPQFNKDMLSSALKSNEILYVHFEKEFGARHTKPSLLDEDGKVDFDKVRESAEFKQGVQRLEKALKLGYTVALMCSEANPVDCHRFSMISCQLVREGLQVHHILQDPEKLTRIMVIREASRSISPVGEYPAGVRVVSADGPTLAFLK